MTNKELVHKIIDIYVDARKSKYPNTNIFRDRSHTTASTVEDLFALYILKHFQENSNIKVFIDKGINIKLHDKNKKIYPDIIVVKENQIIGIIDMKMDLGWSRDSFYSKCQQYAEYLDGLKNNISFKEIGENIIVSPNIIYQVIVVSKLNISEKNLKHHLDLFEASDIKNKVAISFLTSKHHPNEWSTQEIKNNIIVHDDEFSKIISILNNY